MARTAQPTRATKGAAIKRRIGRPPGSKNKVKTTAQAETVPTKRTAAARKKTVTPTRAAAVSRPPVVTKDELRAQVEKLERTIATLRTENREATRAAKDATARIEALDAQVTNLEKAAIPKEAPVRKSAGRGAASAPVPKPAKSTRRKRSDERDPGGAVPPGVAVQEPEPVDAEAETARQKLEEHLSGDEAGSDKEQ